MANRIRNSLLFVAIAASLVTLAVGTGMSQGQPPFSYQTNGTLSSGQQYELAIEEGSYIRRKDEVGDDWSRWGIDGGFAGTYVTKFDLVVDGQGLWIPRKLYEDLSYVSSVDAYDYHGALRIDLKGGDGAGSYRASFLFSGWDIERLVRHGEFPDSRWEYVVEHSSVAEVTDGANPPIPPSSTSLNPDSNRAPD